MKPIQWICIFVILLGMWVLYIQNYQVIIGKENFKKLSKICEREFRNQADELKLIVDKFIKEYEEEHDIIL